MSTVATKTKTVKSKKVVAEKVEEPVVVLEEVSPEVSPEEVVSEKVVPEKGHKSLTGTQRYEKCIQYLIDNRNLGSDELVKALGKLAPKGSKFSNKKESDVKRPQNAYMFFCDVKRSETPDKKMVAKELGEMWSKLGPEEKKPFEVLALNDKERYNNESHSDSEEKEKEVKKDRASDPNYILNPASGKYVLRNGSIGKKLLST